MGCQEATNAPISIQMFGEAGLSGLPDILEPGSASGKQDICDAHLSRSWQLKRLWQDHAVPIITEEGDPPRTSPEYHAVCRAASFQPERPV
jgi:hypothetical protein